MQLFIFVTLGVCVISIIAEDPERTASLVVLPPLVLGYDELYIDNQEGSPEKNAVNSRMKKPEPEDDYQAIEESVVGEWAKPTEANAQGKPKPPQEWPKPAQWPPNAERPKPTALTKPKPAERSKPEIEWPKPTEKPKPADKVVTVAMVKPNDLVKPVDLVKTADLVKMVEMAQAKPIARTAVDNREAKIKVLKRLPLERLVLYDDNAVQGEDAVIIPQQRIILRSHIDETRRANAADQLADKNFYLNNFKPKEVHRANDAETIVTSSDEWISELRRDLQTNNAQEFEDIDLEGEGIHEKNEIEGPTFEDLHLKHKFVDATEEIHANNDFLDPKLGNFRVHNKLTDPKTGDIHFHGEFNLPEHKVKCTCHGEKH